MLRLVRSIVETLLFFLLGVANYLYFIAYAVVVCCEREPCLNGGNVWVACSIHGFGMFGDGAMTATARARCRFEVYC